MIRVYVGNNIIRTAIDVTSDTTLRRAFEEAEVDYGTGTNSLDGATLKAGDLDKTFEEMGVTGEKCYLMNIAKAVNAAPLDEHREGGERRRTLIERGFVFAQKVMKWISKR